MKKFKILYSQALRTWLALVNSDIETRNQIVNINSSPANCFRYIADCYSWEGETGIARASRDDCYEITIRKVGGRETKRFPDLTPHENNVHGRASRYAMRKYAEILKEHGHSKQAKNMIEFIERIEAEIVNNITEKRGG